MPDTTSWRETPELAAELEQEQAKYRNSLLEIADAMPPDFSEEALALQFAAKHADDARYVAKWGRWVLWNGTSWEHDDTLRAFSLARMIARVVAADTDGPTAKTIASKSTVASIITLARADQRLAATVKQWDADPLKLNTPGEKI